jgi:hypothetical protein
MYKTLEEEEEEEEGLSLLCYPQRASSHMKKAMVMVMSGDGKEQKTNKYFFLGS